MMVRSSTSALAAGVALTALLVGGTSIASAQEAEDISCGDATAVAFNAQAAVDAKNAELVNLRAALDLALEANDDEVDNTPEQDQAIVDAQAAVDAETAVLEDLTADVDAAVEVRDQACAPGTEPGSDVESPGTEPADTDGSSSGDDRVTGGGFDQIDADDVPVGSADTGGR